MVTISEIQKMEKEEKYVEPKTDIHEDGFHTSCGQAYIRFDKVN